MGDEIHQYVEDLDFGPCECTVHFLLLSQSFVQMHKYRDRKKELSTVAPNPPVQRAPAMSRVAPTRFKVNDFDFEEKHTVSSTVDAEFKRYSSAEMTSEDTHILQFWEVSSLLLYHSTTQSSG
jgi:hypothetical protein